MVAQRRVEHGVELGPLHAFVALRPGRDARAAWRAPARAPRARSRRPGRSRRRGPDRGAYARTSASMLEPRPEISTATADRLSHDGWRTRRSRDTSFRPDPRTVQPRSPGLDLADLEDRFSSLFQRLRDVLHIVSARRSAAMPMPQLKVRAISPGSILPCAWRKAISRGCGQASASIRAWRPSGRTRGIFSSRPPPVICASAADLAGADQRQQRLHIDAGRLEQRLDQQPVLIEQGRAGRASSPCRRRAGGPARSRSNGRPTRRGRG